jgi:hypothetical protein
MTEKLSVFNHNTEVQLCTRTAAAAIARDGQIDREQTHTHAWNNTSSTTPCTPNQSVSLTLALSFSPKKHSTTHAYSLIVTAPKTDHLAQKHTLQFSCDVTIKKDGLIFMFLIVFFFSFLIFFLGLWGPSLRHM